MPNWVETVWRAPGGNPHWGFGRPERSRPHLGAPSHNAEKVEGSSADNHDRHFLIVGGDKLPHRLERRFEFLCLKSFRY